MDKECDCYEYPGMHDKAGVCVNYDLHPDGPCAPKHAIYWKIKGKEK